VTSERAALHSRRLALASDTPAIGGAAVAALLDLCAAQAAVAWLPVYSDDRPKRTEVFLGGELLRGAAPADALTALGDDRIAEWLAAKGGAVVRVTDASRSARVAVAWDGPDAMKAGAAAALELLAGHISASVERAEAQRLLATTRSALREIETQITRTRRVRALGELASGIVHDFNNCLTTILGFTELSLGPLEESDAFFDDLSTIRTAALDAAALVRRLQATSGTRHVSEEREVIDLRELARSMPRFAHPRWSRLTQCEGVSFDMVVDLAPVPPVYVSVTEIRELLLNLAFNAVDAMPKGGRITISTRDRDGEAEICVTDQGTGMDAETLGRLFEPFFTTKGDRGCGLGLSVCKTIAENHGGRLAVSTALGEGSTFTLRLPPAPAELLKRPVEPPRAASSTERAQRVLLVDDQAEVRDSVGEMLRALGHTVTVAPDGNAALAVALRTPLDVVITDLGMPGMNGIDVARRLRAIASGMPVVLLTGWGVDDEETIPDNVASVLHKPVTMQSLSEALALCGNGEERRKKCS
jgi:signal transduction histidine kinase/ActR/RegA family two-component response regulator